MVDEEDGGLPQVLLLLAQPGLPHGEVGELQFLKKQESELQSQ